EHLPLLREAAFGFIVVMPKDMREQMRGAAYTALKEADSDEVVPYFEDGLSDGSSAVRFLAVEGLGKSKTGRQSSKLRSAIADPAGQVKSLVVKTLGRTSDPTVIPLLESAAKDELATVRISPYGALIKLGRKDMWDELKRIAQAANPEDRAEAIKIIADMEDQRGVPLMMESLSYKQPSVRGAAVRGLGRLGRKEARPKIEQLLKDPVPAVRRAAVASLADVGGRGSLVAITNTLNDSQVMVREAAIIAFLQLNQPFDTVAPTTRALARHNDPAARSSAAFALGKATKVNRPEAIVVLASLAADPLPGPKIVAIRSLGHIGDRGVLPDLKEALHDQNEAVRATAGGALLHVMAPVK